MSYRKPISRDDMWEAKEKKLKNERCRRGEGWTQKDMCERISKAGYKINDPRLYRAWENGERRIPSIVVEILCTIFNKKPEELGLKECKQDVLSVEPLPGVEAFAPNETDEKQAVPIEVPPSSQETALPEPTISITEQTRSWGQTATTTKEQDFTPAEKEKISGEEKHVTNNETVEKQVTSVDLTTSSQEIASSGPILLPPPQVHQSTEYASHNSPQPSSTASFMIFPRKHNILLLLLIMLIVGASISVWLKSSYQTLSLSSPCFRPQGLFKIVSAAKKKVLQIRSSGIHASLEIAPDTEEEKQYWYFLAQGNTFGIMNDWSGLGLDAPNASQNIGIGIQQFPYSGADNQLWTCKASGSEFIKIIGKSSKLVLGIPANAQGDGAQIDQEQDTDTVNQLWKLVPVSLSLCNLPLQQASSHEAVNAALLTPVTASSSVEWKGWGAAAATDGQRSSTAASMGWSSLNDATIDHHEWIELHLGKCMLIHQVDLFPRNDQGNEGDGFPIDFVIQISSDATHWEPVVSKDNYPKPEPLAQQFTFPPHSTRYVRIVGTHLRPVPGEGNAYRMQFAEVEIY